MCVGPSTLESGPRCWMLRPFQIGRRQRHDFANQSRENPNPRPPPQSRMDCPLVDWGVKKFPLRTDASSLRHETSLLLPNLNVYNLCVFAFACPAVASHLNSGFPKPLAPTGAASQSYHLPPVADLLRLREKCSFNPLPKTPRRGFRTSIPPHA